MATPRPPFDMDEDVSPLEYARCNGLARNHLADRSGLLELESLQMIENAQLEGPHLPTLNFGSEPRLEERLLVSKDAALLLESAIRAEDPRQIDSLIVSLLKEKSLTSRLKLEVPLLRSDHETDCNQFGCRKGFEPKIQDVKLPLELINEKKYESLTASAELSNYGPELMDKLKLEKLCVTKEALLFLQQSMKELKAVEDTESTWEIQQTYKRNAGRDPVTPLLSPIEPEIQVYQPSPSDSVYEVPISFDPISPTKQELQSLEAGIFRHDFPTPIRDTILNSSIPSSEAFPGDSYFKMGHIYLPSESQDDLQDPFLLEATRVTRDNLKIDEALTPQSSAPEFPKSVKMDDVAEELEVNPERNQVSQIFETSPIEQVFLSAYEEVNQRVEQETLMEADVTCRVEVPIMNFSKPTPPWEVHGTVLKQTPIPISLQQGIIKEVFSKENVTWPASKKVDQKLRWNPFPRDLTTHVLEAPQLDDSTWEEFVPNPNGIGIMDSSGSVWKPEGLKISREDDDDDDEEELDPGDFQADGSRDEVSSMKKRQWEMEEKNFQSRDRTSANTEAPYQTQFAFSQPNMKGEKSLRNNREDFELLSGAAFSAENAIDNFLKLRGVKKQKLDDSPYVQSAHSVASDHRKLQAGESAYPDASNPTRPSPETEQATLPTLPVPPICHDKPLNLVVASKMLARRQLIQSIEENFPQMNFVERDFSAHTTTTWLPGSVARSPVSSPLENEADIIVSPTTGIILTSLQKIRQKPLPGQKSQNAIRTRLMSISTRYEKLFVLVSEGGADERSIGLDTNSCLAFCEFCGFTLTIHTTVTVQFVGGGEKTLARWLCGVISHYHVDGPDLLHEETRWELFLRRAGFNAFAAQAIVANLKTPMAFSGDGSMKNFSLGLAGFVEMSAEQRMERFGKLVGRRVMRRVSTLIDSRWDI